MDIGKYLKDVVFQIAEKQRSMRPVLIGGRLDDIDFPGLERLICKIDIGRRNPEAKLRARRRVGDGRPVIGPPTAAQAQEQGSHSEGYPVFRFLLDPEIEDIGLETLHPVQIVTQDDDVIHAPDRTKTTVFIHFCTSNPRGLRAGALPSPRLITLGFGLARGHRFDLQQPGLVEDIGDDHGQGRFMAA